METRIEKEIFREENLRILQIQTNKPNCLLGVSAPLYGQMKEDGVEEGEAEEDEVEEEGKEK